MRISRLITWLAALALALGSSAGWAEEPVQVAAAPPSKPQAVVESLHQVLITCMKGDCGPDFQSRLDAILANLDETFDLPFMARMSIGKAWKTLSPEEQEFFVGLSRSYSASNYASNFDSYGGQHFQTLGEEPAARGTILVKTEFVQPADDNVKFDYRLRKAGDDWKIIDITLDGKVSEITMRRADYSAVISRKGFPELVDAIEKKIENLADE